MDFWQSIKYQEVQYKGLPIIVCIFQILRIICILQKDVTLNATLRDATTSDTRASARVEGGGAQVLFLKPLKWWSAANVGLSWGFGRVDDSLEREGL